jgi:threonine dehydrogenase-like Zn-dependent dehydrogenase
MRALVLDGEVRLDAAYPMPQHSQGDALVRVSLAGICNTDLELIKGYRSFKGILGHEFVGLVEQCSDPDLIGARVVGEINAQCGRCPICKAGMPTHCPNRTVLGITSRDGAFADYLILPQLLLHRVPDSVPDQAAVFTEPLAAALEIPEQLQVQPTQRVVVVGDGKLGLLVAQVLRLTGCDLMLVGRRERKLQIAANAGIRTHLAATALETASADIVVECTGNPEGFALARNLVRPRGTLVLKSTYHGDSRVDFSSIVVDELTLVGSRCGPFAPALQLLAMGMVDVESLVDAVYPISSGVAAVEHAATPGTLKVLLSMDP